MATGTAWNDGGAVGLWAFNLKVNGPRRGFNLKFHITEKNEADAKLVAQDIGAKFLFVLPGDCEVIFATISKDDSAKDSKFVPSCLGDGLYQSSAGPPIVLGTVNMERDSLLVRFESAGPNPVSRLFPCLPDDRVVKQALATPIDPVTAIPVANPAVPTDATLWEDNYNILLQTLVLSTSHVKVGHVPGGVYTYFPWNAAYPLRIATKKGGRDFI